MKLMSVCGPIIIWVLSQTVWMPPCLAREGVFPDKNLEAAIRSQVFDKRNTDKPLTKEDAKKVWVLKARGKGIKNLAGLEHCTNLGELDLSDNRISDIGPVKALTSLQSLNLSKNRIADIKPLAGLTKLQYLELSHNQVSDISPLAKLKKINALYLTGNKITDLSPLQGLEKVWSCYLGGNPLNKVDVLGKLKWVSTLELTNCGLTNVPALKGMKNLSMLFLDGNKLTDLKPLVEIVKEDAEGEKRFASLLRLYVKGNPLSEKAKKEQLSALKKFGVRIDPDSNGA